MKLWIRNQDKEILTMVDYFDIREQDGEWLITTQKTQSRMPFSLGKYKSKERALEVLTEIEIYLMSGSIENTNLIFSMPKE